MTESKNEEKNILKHVVFSSDFKAYFRRFFNDRIKNLVDSSGVDIIFLKT